MSAMASSKISIGICVYNEEANIGRLLHNLLRLQDLPEGTEILVVCSGCTDSSPTIVRGFCKKDRRVKMLLEPERLGKSSAVNKILNEYTGDFLFLISADSIPHKGAVWKVLRGFDEDNVGIVGGSPTPINEGKSANGVEAIAHLMWRLHNRTLELLSHDGVLTHACGEMFCMRRGIVSEVPLDVINDDKYISLQADRRGYRVLFDSEAKVTIKVPSTISDLLNQRRRVTYGHYQLKKMLRCSPRTLDSMMIYDPKRVIRIFADFIQEDFKRIPILIPAIILELAANLAALLDIAQGKNYTKWIIATTTKSLAQN